MRYLYVILLFAFLVAPLASCGSSTTTVFDLRMAQTLQQSLDRSVSELNIPGAVMAVRAPDGSIWSGASGYATLPNSAQPSGVRMTTDMHLRIASMIKSFTATMILQLVDEGKLTLDETLDQVMAQWFAPGVIDFAIPYSDAITIRHLLEMRSGMPNYSNTPAFLALLAQQPPQPVEAKELIRMSVQSANPAPYPPDTRMEYCNTNYIVLGMIVEQVTGNPYAVEWHRRHHQRRTGRTSRSRPSPRTLDLLERGPGRGHLFAMRAHAPAQHFERALQFVADLNRMKTCFIPG